MHKFFSDLADSSDEVRNLELLDIYKTHDYREYLRQWLQSSKAEALSVRKLAKLMKISSGHLSDILTHRRPMTKSIYNKLIPHLKINKQAQDFLWLLVEFIDGQDFKTRQNAFLKLKNFKSYQSRHQEELTIHEYLSNWHHFAIRELTDIKDFKLDPVWIRKRLRYELSLAEIKESLEFLIKNKFIIISSSGQAKPGELHIRGEGEALKLAVANGHLGIMNQATQSIYKTSRDKRHLLSHTTGFNQSQMPQVKSILENALEKLRTLAQENEKDSVYNFSLYAFPLTDEGDDVS